LKILNRRPLFLSIKIKMRNPYFFLNLFPELYINLIKIIIIKKKKKKKGKGKGKKRKKENANFNKRL
jgi:hypothetical protein